MDMEDYDVIVVGVDSPGVPLAVLRDVIQPFPTFSEIYVAALKALCGQIKESP